MLYNPFRNVYLETSGRSGRPLQIIIKTLYEKLRDAADQEEPKLNRGGRDGCVYCVASRLCSRLCAFNVKRKFVAISDIE